MLNAAYDIALLISSQRLLSPQATGSDISIVSCGDVRLFMVSIGKATEVL
jgi:hypothetical protein